MPFIKKNDAQGSQPPTDARNIFIGRIGELLFFVQNILKPRDPTHNIISISGQGGVGKSTLLARFIDEAHSTNFKDYCLTAIVGERQTTPASIMEKFADQLRITGKFEKALKQYKEILRKLQTKRETMQDTLLRSFPDFAGAAAESVPIAGPLLREGVKAGTKHLLGRYYTDQIRRDAEILEDPLDDLTKAFVEELNLLAETQVMLSINRVKRLQVILFFDTFEQLAVDVAPWLLNYFLEANINNHVVLVIAGRDPIEQSTPADPKCWLPYHDSSIIYSISLDVFTEEETRLYLAERGVTDPDGVATIWQLSQGLPLYLGLLTSNPHGKVDPTANVVANFLRWIPEQERIKRQLALDAALFSRSFNQDDLEAFTYLSEYEQSALYRWLIGQPFVHPQDGRYIYHDLAGALFSRHLYQHSRKGYYATRRVLADHYQRLLTEVQKEQGREVHRSPEWLELKMALAHQCLLLPDEGSHIKAIEQILSIHEHVRIKQTGEVVKVLREKSQEQPDNLANSRARQIARHLLHYFEANPKSQELIAAANYLLDYVAHEPTFPAELLAQIYRCRGWAYRRLVKDIQRAIQDYDHAIELTPNLAFAYNNRGFAYQTLKDYRSAIQDFDQAIELDPNFALAYSNRGLAYAGLEEYQRAFQDFDRAIKLDPNYSWIYDSRGWVYLNLKEYQRAIQDFDRAIELDPNFAGAYAKRGQAYSKLGKYQQAFQDFDRAIELDPNYIWTYTYRGSVYLNLKEYQQAIQDYERAIELDSNLAWAYDNRGWLYTKVGEYQQAIQDCNRAIELDPTDPWAYANRGWAYLNLKEHQRAIQDFNQAIELDPNFARAYNRRGYTFWTLKEYQKAIQDYNRATELDPTDPWAYANRGLAYSSLGEYQRAIQDCNRAIELDPNLDWAYHNRGLVYLNLKDYPRAIQDYGHAIELDPTDAPSHFERGYAHLNINNIQQAQADFNASWEIDSTVAKYGWMATWSCICEGCINSEAVEQLDTIANNIDSQQHEVFICRGVGLWFRGEFKEALTELENAISSTPNSKDTFFWKGIVYASLGEYQEAQATIEKSLELGLPPVLLYTLRWFEHRKIDFYEQYAAPLLTRYDL